VDARADGIARNDSKLSEGYDFSMRMLWRERLGSSFGIVIIALILLGTGAVFYAGANQPQQNEDLLVVTDAKVPSYPSVARMSGFQGVVRLQVSTDGEGISKVQLLDGQIVLAGAAMDNVKTWRFRWHERTTFETVFRYKLLPERVCDAENPTVVLHLPLEIEVTAKGMKTCDSFGEIKPR